MNNAIDLEWTEEDTLTNGISDEALEAAGGRGVFVDSLFGPISTAFRCCSIAINQNDTMVSRNVSGTPAI